MSYELKKQIKDDLKALHEMRRFAEWRGSEMTINDKYVELDLVYAQATKADDYEAKAEALDAIMREWEDERVTKSHILETIQMYYNKYESGELDAKK